MQVVLLFNGSTHVNMLMFIEKLKDHFKITSTQ